MGAKHSFTFLVEGSVSLSYQPGTSALKMVLDDLAALDLVSTFANSFTLAAGFFGPEKGVTWFAPYNLQNPKARVRLGAGLRYGSGLSPSVEQVTGMVVETKEPTHLVIVSSDDVYDNDHSEKALEKFLKSNPQSTLDAVIIGDKEKGFEQMLCRLKKSCPQQVGKINVHAFESISDNLFSGIVESHLTRVPPASHKKSTLKK